MFQFPYANKKPDTKQIIVRVLLYLSMVFSVLASTERTYNSLAFGNFELDLGTFERGAFLFVRILLPFLMGALYYFVYRIFVSLITNKSNSNMRVFNKLIDKDMVRNFVDPVFIILCIIIGCIDYVVLLFPFLSNIFAKPIKIILAMCSMYCIFRYLKRGLEIEFYPIIVNSLFFPALIMVVLI